jgi:hypothetical protein
MDATDTIARRFEALPKLVAADPDLVRRGRFLDCDFVIGIGAQDLLVAVRAGQVASVTRGPFLLKPWVFAIRAGAATWDAFLAPVPKAGWHDILALNKVGRAKIEGTLQPFMANLQYIKDVLAAPRAGAYSEVQR